MAEATLIHPAFAHRTNRDGTIDSICRECFVTVATALWESELDQPEQTHVCDPWVLKQYNKKLPGREIAPANPSKHAAA